MSKELYLYTSIYSDSAQQLIQAMDKLKGKDFSIRMNTPGGNPLAAWGIVGKMQEAQKAGSKVTIKVDGAANSMGLFMLPFADKVQALDVSTGLLHRADMYIPDGDLQAQSWLNDRNKDLRSKLSAKINEQKLKEVKGVSLDDVFDPTKRIDVSLTANQMKDIGLVDDVIEVGPAEMNAINEGFYSFAASSLNQPQPEKKSDNLNSDKMTLDELKAKHPDLFAAAVKEGILKERDRVGSYMAFAHVDLDSVKAGIKDGKDLSATEMAEFSLKVMNPDALAALKKDNAKPTATTETKETHGKGELEAKTALAAFEAEVDAALKA